jgi:hypothetical protein
MKFATIFFTSEIDVELFAPLEQASCQMKSPYDHGDFILAAKRNTQATTPQEPRAPDKSFPSQIINTTHQISFPEDAVWPHVTQILRLPA